MVSLLTLAFEIEYLSEKRKMTFTRSHSNLHSIVIHWRWWHSNCLRGSVRLKG